MTLAMSASAQQALFAGLLRAIDGAGEGATLILYDGAQPEPGAAANETLKIATLLLPHPAGQALPDGLHLFAAIALATGAGLPRWGRICDGAGQWVLDGDAGASGLFVLSLSHGTQMYPGGEVAFAGGVIGF